MVTYITQWGHLGGGWPCFNFPYGVAVDTSGNVYVADTANNRIQKFQVPPIFYDDFNGDTVNSLPNNPPKSGPGTISLSCNGSSSPLPYGDCSPTSISTILVQNTIPGFNTQSLKLDKGSTSGNSPVFRAYPQGVTPGISQLTSGVYTFQWSVLPMRDLALQDTYFFACCL